MTIDDLQTLTVEKAAEVLGVHPESVRRWVRDGRLPAGRWGGRLRITLEAIRKFQESCQVRQADPADLVRTHRRGFRHARA